MSPAPCTRTPAVALAGPPLRWDECSICIPSYNRYGVKLARTLKLVARFKPRCRVALVVRHSQRMKYNGTLLKLGLTGKVDVVLTGDKGVVQARNDGIEYLLKRGHRKMMIVDDDVSFATREEGRLLTLRTQAEFFRLCRMFFGMLDKYAHCALSTRVSNRPHKPEVVEVARGHTCVGYRLDVLQETGQRFELEGREGLDFTLRLLSMGYPNAVLYRYSVNSCGASSRRMGDGQRMLEWTMGTAKALSRRFPNVVQAYQNNFKSGPRGEVRVQWKEALVGKPKYLDKE